MSELIEVKESSLIEAFTDSDGLSSVVRQAEIEVRKFEHDLTTDVGRKRTASLANKVAKLKVKLDSMGKELVSGWKEKAKAVDVNRKAMRDSLDELKADARKPLTDWEDEEKERLELERAAKETAELNQKVASDHELGLLMNDKINRESEDIKAAAIAREEESERIRIAEQKLHDEKVASEAKEESEQLLAREKERAEQAEKDKILAQKQAEIEKALFIEREIESKRLADEAKKKADEGLIKAREQAVIDAENAEKEKKRIEVLELEKRETDKAHISKIRKSAKLALMDVITEQEAKKIILAINAGKIPHIKINY